MTTTLVVGVVGGGLMGSGIAQVAALAGHRTILRELDDALCARARAAIERSMSRAIEKGKLTGEARDAALECLTFATTLEGLAECDLVIEAIVEHLESKRALWKALDAIVPSQGIFASNTSSLSIVEQATATQAGGSLRRTALLQPGAGDAAGRGGAVGGDERRDDASRDGVRAVDRQGADRRA